MERDRLQQWEGQLQEQWEGQSHRFERLVDLCTQIYGDLAVERSFFFIGGPGVQRPFFPTGPEYNTYPWAVILTQYAIIQIGDGHESAGVPYIVMHMLDDVDRITTIEDGNAELRVWANLHKARDQGNAMLSWRANSEHGRDVETMKQLLSALAGALHNRASMREGL